MTESQTLERARIEGWSDEDVVQRVVAGDVLLFELLMRRHNQRIYRAVRSVLRDDGEVEDVMQEAYVRAYRHLGQFEGRARFSTWLTRIAVNEAIKRAVARGRFDPIDEEGLTPEEETMLDSRQSYMTPEENALRSEVGTMLETAILALPDHYRTVVMLRDVEEMSTAETAEALSLTQANVKVRLHRAHEMLREDLVSRSGASHSEAFLFHAMRCDRVVAGVMVRLSASDGSC